jgi:hypothetical protein
VLATDPELQAVVAHIVIGNSPASYELAIGVYVAAGDYGG